MKLNSSQVMHLNGAPRPSGGTAVTAKASSAKGVSYGLVAWKHKFLILGGLILGLIVGVAADTFRTPLYSASSTVEIVGANSRFMGMSQLDPEASQSDLGAVAFVQTQVRVLTSRALIRRVLDRMNIELTPVSSAPATIFTRLRNRLPFLRPEPLLQSRQAAAIAARTLSVHAVGATRMLEISCQSTSPSVAAAFVNTLTAEHVAQTVAARANATQHTSQWMDSQMEEARSRLQEASEKLRDFVQKSGMDFFPEQSTLADTKMRKLQADVASIQADRIAKQARWELAKSTPLDRLPDVMGDGTMQGIKSQIQMLRRDMAELMTTLTPEHLKVKRLQSQIDELSQALEKEESIFLKRTQSDYEAALHEEKLLQGAYNSQTYSVSGQADKASQYAMLRREVDTQQQLYNTLLQEADQAAVVALAPTTGLHVIDTAGASMIPASPSPTKDIPIASLAGGAFVYGLLLLRELGKRKKRMALFDMPGHTQALLGVPELGVIPNARAQQQARKRMLPAKSLSITEAGASSEPDNDLSERLEPAGLNGALWNSTLLSESFRQTLVSLLRARPKDHNPAYVLTSTGPGEGKTSVAANLARAMAEVGQRVILLDADLRKPRLHTLLGIEGKEGLADILVEPVPIASLNLDRYIQSTPINNLSVITHGSVSVSSPGVLFFSPRLGELIARLKTRFDCVLLDTAPALWLPDARLWGLYADGVVLVVRAGVTSREAASATCERFAQDGIPILGTILNDWAPDPKSPLGYYYGEYDRSSAPAGKS